MKNALPLLGSLLAMSFMPPNARTDLSAGSGAAANTTSSDSAQQNDNFTSQPTRVITPAVAPIVNSGCDVMLSADFILWKSTTDNLQYAVSGVNDGVFVTPTENVGKGHDESPKFKYEPGFKAALGFLFKHDGWDLNFEYTWLNHQRSKNSISAKSGVGLVAAVNTFYNDGIYLSPFLSSASATWKQTFNVLDADLGRNFFISRYLTLRPHAGMKFGWIDSKLGLVYNALPQFGEPAATFDVMLKQNMWGLGIRGGLDTVWHFSKNWGIYGNFDYTALWSFIKSKAKDIQTTAGVTTQNTQEKVQKIVNVFEMGLGFCYMTWWCQDRYQFLIQAGWEEQIWMNYNMISEGNLNIEGLTVKLGFAF